MNMADETISEKCENLYNKLNTFVESEISRDVTPQISNLNSRIDALEPNLVRVKEVNGNTSSISAGGTSTQTFTVPACPSGYNWEYLSTSTGWGTVSSVSLSGTTLTVTLLNVSNSSHDISFSGVLMYYPKTIEAEPHITMIATNPYLLEGEVTDLVVSLVDEFGLPLTNKNLTIGQSVFIDNGTTASHNDSWSVTNGTMTRMDNYTRLVESAQTLMCQMNSAYITPTSTVEFDFKAVDGVKNWGLIYIRNSAGGTSLADLNLNNIGGDIGEWIHLKIVFNNTDTITIYSSKLDNPITRTLSSTDSNYRLLLYGGGTNTELHFKNVIVYNNINAITDENGEFALHNVSVTDDTIFNASYGTETASCLVGYYDFVDYAVTNNKNNTWFNNTGGTITVDDNGTTLTSVPHSNGTHWVSGYCPASTTTAKPFSYPIIVEFDILQWDKGSSIFIKSDLGNKTNFNRELNHIGSRARIEIGTTSTKIYIDGAFVSQKTYTQPSNYGIEIGSYISKNDSPTAPSLKFANFTIRPL